MTFVIVETMTAKTSTPPHRGKHELLPDYLNRLESGLQGRHENRLDIKPWDFISDAPGRHEVRPPDKWTVPDAYHAGVADGHMEEAYDRDSAEPVDLYGDSPDTAPFTGRFAQARIMKYENMDDSTKDGAFSPYTGSPPAEDGTPSWAYNEDGYCVSCDNGHWKHHTPECELRDALDSKKDDIYKHPHDLPPIPYQVTHIPAGDTPNCDCPRVHDGNHQCGCP